MANENKKGLSTNSNAYTLIYATVLVIIVAFLLSFVSSSLHDQQEANEKVDKKKQILSALNIEDADTEAAYSKYISSAYVLGSNGDAKTVEEGKDGFYVDFNNLSNDDNLPLYEGNVDGATKFIIPLSGNGLWDRIWGYVALDADKSTIYGIYFNHAGETPGLGAEITNPKFKDLFKGKHIKNGNEVLSVAVLKKGVKSEIEGQEQVDAISGATLTSDGVNDMLSKCLKKYNSFLTK